jgi:ABC-2 type transport system ATP-binding protein
LLTTRDLHKRYGSIHALSGVDLDVRPGEIVALLGPNGAGKTTLVSIIAGLLTPDSGTVEINGITTGPQLRTLPRQVGLAPQEIAIYPTVSVRDNLRFFGELAGLRRSRLRQRIAAVALTFSLTELLDRKGQHLSGGEARRLHTAMIVLHSPPLLLLDEPTAGLDVEARNELLMVIKTLAEDGCAIVYSTHYLYEVEQLEVPTVAILVEGRIAAYGPIPRLVATHGGAASVELRFSRACPQLDLPEGALQISGDAIRVPATHSPAATAASLLQTLDGAGSALREVRLIEPSLESAFLAVTADRSDATATLL